MNHPRKILFVSTMTGSSWGGSEELWSQAALRLAKAGLGLKAGVKRWPVIPQRWRELESSGCEVIYCPEGIADSRGPGSCRTGLGGGINAAVRLFSFEPDLTVISQGSNLEGLLWGEQCIRRRWRYVLIVQAASPFVWPRDSVASRLAEVYRKAEVCFFVSKANLELTRLQLSSSFRNVKMVSNPFKVRYDARLPWPDASVGYKVACVGRLDPSAKGQDLLLQVLSERKWRHRPLSVSLFGEGRNRESLSRLSRMLRLRNVHFAGFTENVEPIWETHHALVLPSRYEGMPLALVEAMLCGRVGIVTDAGGNKELVEDNVTGFVAQAPTVEHLGEAMERAWERRENWLSMGRVAAERVRELIPCDPVGEFVKDLLKRILRPQGRYSRAGASVTANRLGQNRNRINRVTGIHLVKLHEAHTF